jgi:dTDP-4-amino-4,6-dideoxygalactose transaminase
MTTDASRLAIDGGEPARITPFPFRAQGFGEEEMAQLAEVVHSGKLNRVGGAKTEAVERIFSDLIGVKHALAVSSGTAALHTALAAINPDPGDEVITTPLTDMGTVIGIIAQGAIPVFADVIPGGYHLDPQSVCANVTSRTRAIIVVHNIGQSADMDAFLAISKEYGIPIIEDCAQAYLTTWKGTRVGAMGLINCFSLQQSKHITSGDGGLVITNDDALAQRARLFADKGWDRTAEGRGYPFFGMNYRISELQSAVTLAQLGKLERICSRRKQLGDLLTEKLVGLRGIYPPQLQEGCDMTYWFYPLRIVEEELGRSREWFVTAVRAEGIGCGAWSGLLGQPLYLFEVFSEGRTFGRSHYPFDSPSASRRIEYGPGLCRNAERAARELVAMGLHEFYSEGDIGDTARAVRKVAETARRG